MARLINEGRLLLRIGSPKDEDDGVFLIVDRADDGIGKFLPAFALMGGRHRPLHRQHAVEQQYALPRPTFQKAVTGRRDAEITKQFLVDIHQRRRRTHAWLDAERQTMRLSLAVVRILTENDDTNLVERRQVEGAKILRSLRKDLLAAIFSSSRNVFRLAI